MAVKTLWPITYSCRHSDERDLSAKPADQRAGYARWLSDKQCTDCWHAKHCGTAARTEWEQYCLTPAMEGSAANGPAGWDGTITATERGIGGP
jgi:hypothetical protein